MKRVHGLHGQGFHLKTITYLVCFLFLFMLNRARYRRKIWVGRNILITSQISGNPAARRPASFSYVSTYEQQTVLPDDCMVAK
jgi:hypothetical protein